MKEEYKGHKLTIELYQHGRLDKTDEMEFDCLGKFPDVKTLDKATKKASKLTRQWISENCRPRLIGPGYIRKAENWKYDCGTERTLHVIGGEVKIRLVTIYR